MDRAEGGTTPPTSVGGEKDWQLRDGTPNFGDSAAYADLRRGEVADLLRFDGPAGWRP